MKHEGLLGTHGQESRSGHLDKVVHLSYRQGGDCIYGVRGQRLRMCPKRVCD